MSATPDRLPRQGPGAPEVPLVSVVVRVSGGREALLAEIAGAAEELGWPLDSVEAYGDDELVRVHPGGRAPWALWRALCLRISNVPGVADAACIGVDGGAEGYALFRHGRLVRLESLEWSADETWLRLAEDHETPAEALERHLFESGPLGRLARHLGAPDRAALGLGTVTGGCTRHGTGHAHGPGDAHVPGHGEALPVDAPPATSPAGRGGRAPYRIGAAVAATLLLLTVLWLVFTTGT